MNQFVVMRAKRSVLLSRKWYLHSDFSWNSIKKMSIFLISDLAKNLRKTNSKPSEQLTMTGDA